MDRSTSSALLTILAAAPLPVFAAGTAHSTDWLQSLLISAFFIGPVVAATLISRISPELPVQQQMAVEELHVTEAIGPEEADEFIRQPAIEVVVDAEPEPRIPIRPHHSPKKPKRAA